jgi:hypothetical protein
MTDEDINVIVIEAPVRNETELQAFRGTTEGIWEFVEKVGDRYEIRMKLDKTLWNYLTEIEIVLPILDKIKFKELYMNLMKILGYFLQNFCIITIPSNNYITLICFKDSLIDDLRRNIKIEKCEGNVVNGTLGMKRDTNLQSHEFFHFYEDIREVLFG